MNLPFQMFACLSFLIYLKLKFQEKYYDLLSEENQNDGERKKEKDRFYEPKNWDRKLTIEGPTGSGTTVYCGQCGHIINEGDKFCTKCGTEAKK